jgi:excisionase family DNA binding protein
MSKNPSRQAEIQPALLTINDIAQHWQVSAETVERRIRSGELPALKLGRSVRVRPEALAAYEQTRTLAASL